VETVRIKLTGTDVKPFFVPDDAGEMLLNAGVAELELVPAEATDDPQPQIDKTRWEKMNEKWKDRKKTAVVR
jgi:hypothetical protein